MDEEEDRTIKPNSTFLARMLGGVGRVNQRVTDTTASRAAQKAIGSHGAASLRFGLQRAAKKGPAAVRQSALSGASQQKLILCSALLKEVAHTFGFKLKISHPYGACLVPPGAAAAANASSAVSAAVRREGGPGAAAEAGPAPLGASEGPGMVALEALDVAMLVEEEEEYEEEEEGEEEELEEAQFVGVAAAGQDATVPTRCAPRGSTALSPRPKVQLMSRLTASALGAIGLGARRGAAGTGMAAAPGAAVARRRALLLKRQSSLRAAEEQVSDREPAEAEAPVHTAPATSSASAAASAALTPPRSLAKQKGDASGLEPSTTTTSEPAVGMKLSGRKIVWPAEAAPATHSGAAPPAAVSSIGAPHAGAPLEDAAAVQSALLPPAVLPPAVGGGETPTAGTTPVKRRQVTPGGVSLAPKVKAVVAAAAAAAPGTAAVPSEDPGSVQADAPGGGQSVRVSGAVAAADAAVAASAVAGVGAGVAAGAPAGRDEAAGAPSNTGPAAASGGSLAGSKRMGAGLTGLFGAAMRDIKKVKNGDSGD